MFKAYTKEMLKDIHTWSGNEQLAFRCEMIHQTLFEDWSRDPPSALLPFFPTAYASAESASLLGSVLELTLSFAKTSTNQIWLQEASGECGREDGMRQNVEEVRGRLRGWVRFDLAHPHTSSPPSRHVEKFWMGVFGEGNDFW